MTKNELNIKYFNWICQLVCSDKKYEDKIISHRKLLKYLHDTPFVYVMNMDGNRYEDGICLRYRFCYEKKIDYSIGAKYLDTRDCSVLELMVALSLRCEEEIMNDPVYGDRIGEWFWEMIDSLGLSDMTDDTIDYGYVSDCLDIFMQRRYLPNGKGGLFTFENSKKDMRFVEIWDQMCWHLNDILRKEGFYDE